VFLSAPVDCVCLCHRHLRLALAAHSCKKMSRFEKKSYTLLYTCNYTHTHMDRGTRTRILGSAVPSFFGSQNEISQCVTCDKNKIIQSVVLRLSYSVGFLRVFYCRCSWCFKNHMISRERVLPQVKKYPSKSCVCRVSWSSLISPLLPYRV